MLRAQTPESHINTTAPPHKLCYLNKGLHHLSVPLCPFPAIISVHESRAKSPVLVRELLMPSGRLVVGRIELGLFL